LIPCGSDSQAPERKEGDPMSAGAIVTVIVVVVVLIVVGMYAAAYEAKKAYLASLE
jgi:hypothetical protein